jgi:hypothetical protein
MSRYEGGKGKKIIQLIIKQNLHWNNDDDLY